MISVVFRGTIGRFHKNEMKPCCGGLMGFSDLSGVLINLATASFIIKKSAFSSNMSSYKPLFYNRERKKRTQIVLPLLTSAAERLFTLYLDPFFVAVSLDNSVHVDAGYVDVLFGKSPNIHHLLHLRREAQRWAPPSPATALIPWPSR